MNVDAPFSRKRKVPAAGALKGMNQYLEYFRRNGARYQFPVEGEPAFFSWLAVFSSGSHGVLAELEREAGCAGRRMGDGPVCEYGDARVAAKGSARRRRTSAVGGRLAALESPCPLCLLSRRLQVVVAPGGQLQARTGGWIDLQKWVLD